MTNPFKGFDSSLQRRIRDTAGGIPGHSPVHDVSRIPDILASVFGQFPIFGQRIPGHGEPAPDAMPLNKGFEDTAAENAPTLWDILKQLAFSGQQGDPNALYSQAQSQVNAQYDPQIAELQRQMAMEQQLAGRNKVELGNMYGALSNSDMADIDKINQIYAQGNKGVDQQYKDIQSQLAATYADTQKQEQDLMTKLNIQAAAPDALKQQNTDQAYLQGQQKLDHQSAIDALKLLQTGAQDFSRSGAEIARAEGTNQQANLMQQLQDYMTQAQGKIGDLNLAKSNSFQSVLGQLSNQQYSRSQDQFQNLLALARLQQSMQGAGGTQYKQGPLAASGYLGENSPDNATQLNSFLLQVLQDPQFTQGQVQGINGPVRLTPEAAAQMAQQKAAEAGMSPESQQQIYMAMLAYYGRMY